MGEGIIVLLFCLYREVLLHTLRRLLYSIVSDIDSRHFEQYTILLRSSKPILDINNKKATIPQKMFKSLNVQ